MEIHCEEGTERDLLPRSPVSVRKEHKDAPEIYGIIRGTHQTKADRRCEERCS